MIKIAFPESTALPVGGYQYSMLDIIRHLADGGEPVQAYYVTHANAPAHAAATRQSLPATVISLCPDGFPGWKRPWWVVRYVWLAWRFLRRERIDIVHASNETLLFWLLPCLLCGAVPIWNVRAELPFNRRGRLRLRLHTLLCRRIIYVSDAARRSVEAHGLPARGQSVLIRNFVPRHLVERPVVFRAEGKPRISFVGRVDDPNKRAELALAIAVSVLTSHPDCAEFHFWGRLTDAVRQELVRAIPKSLTPNIVFHGITHSSEEIYAQTDVLLLTSLSEGSPRVIMEAGACGIPTLATPAGGVPELIVDGMTGGLFEGLEQGAAMLEKWILDSERRQALGRNARRHFLENFHYAGMIRQYIEFYRDCLGGERFTKEPGDTDVEHVTSHIAA